MKSSAAADIRTIVGALPASRRQEILLISLLMPVAAAAEMLMVAAIVPLLAILAGTNRKMPLLSVVLERIEEMGARSPLTAAAILFLAAAIVTALLRLVLARATLRFAAGFGHDLNMALQHRLLHQPYLFHVSINSSKLLASLEKVDLLVFDFAQRGLQGLSATVIALAVIAALLQVDPASAAAAALLVTLLYGAVSMLMRRRLATSVSLMTGAHECRLQQFQENLGGIRDVIIDGSQSSRLTTFAEIDKRFMLARAEANFLSSAPRYLVEGVGLCLIALLGLFLATRPGGLPAALPILGALALGAQRLLPLAGQIHGAWTSLAFSRPIVGDVADMLRLPVDYPEEAVAALPFTKSISFHGVGFHYPARSGPALRQLDFTIPRGARVAIIGKTGSGKSTLADLIMGLIEPTEGEISVDGKQLTGGMIAAWRKSISHVPQSIFLADASIARNIALVPPDQEPDLARVADAAGIAQFDQFVASLPDGYRTLVGERGARLSGGQRQRLALARAIYRQAPLLVLDEATNALDEETEEAVLASLDQLHAQGCTIVIIAHRLSTVESCDLVLALDEGSLVESGTARELHDRLHRMERRGAL